MFHKMFHRFPATNNRVRNFISRQFINSFRSLNRVSQNLNRILVGTVRVTESIPEESRFLPLIITIPGFV